MMKKRIGASALLALILAVSLCSCTITPPDLSGLISLDGSGGHDTSFVPQEIPEFVAIDFESAYSDQLTANEKAIFDAIAAAQPGQNFFPVTLPDRLEVCKGAEPSSAMQSEAFDRLSYWITNALAVVRLEMPELFWLDTGYYSLTATFEVDANHVYHVSAIELMVRLKSESNQTEGLTKRAGSDPTVERQWLDLQAVAAELTLTGTTDASRVVEINAFLCNRIQYDLSAPNRDSIVGALLDGRAVCEGYAQAFLFLCKRAGIACASIVGRGVTDEGTEGHMWSAVRLEDGIWYVTDVTWNDTTGENAFLLTGLNTEYGNRTFAASHLEENRLGESKQFALPACSYTPY